MTQIISDNDFRTAMLATLGRIANGIESLIKANETADDTLVFPLGDYKAFDWAKIGATIVQSDEFGVSVIRAANGRMANRRSNEKFGNEVWFSYGTGKDADGTPKYHRVIEFREVKGAEPLGRKTEQALKRAEPTPTPTTNDAPPKRNVISDELRAEYVAAFDAARRLNTPVPAEWGIFAEDTESTLRTKINALLIQALHVSRDEMTQLLAVADAIECVVPPQFREIDHAALTELDMRIATAKNLIAAHKRGATDAPKANTSTPAPRSAPATPTATPTTTPEAKRSAAQVREFLQAKVATCNRATTPRQDGDVVRALEVATGSKEPRQAVTRYLFGEAEYSALTPKQRYTLWDWLRPSGETIFNAAARDEIARILDAAKEQTPA